MLSKLDFDGEWEAERGYIAMLYDKLDGQRRTMARQLDETVRDPTATTPQARWHRQVAADGLSARLQALRAADAGLCFGRVDEVQGAATYIGKIGLFDETHDYEPLLVDWRAPAARPFYCATAANPQGVVRRRHFRTRGREITTFHDDVLDPAVADGARGGDAALLAALNAPRQGAMRDIVETIQAEQDEIIRLGDRAAVVLEGGPGTGKTAVALHRVAYLLYTHRERLALRGVLMIGPSHGFLRYIDTVLPSLGETSVVFTTMGELLPEVRTTAEDSSHAKRVKGEAGMVQVLAAAVADRQELPAEPIPIALQDLTITVDEEVTARARNRARAAALVHNDAQGIFRDQLIQDLVDRAVAALGHGWLTREDTGMWGELAADVRAELTAHPELDTAVQQLWPVLTPQRLLADLLSSRPRLAVAAASLEEGDREALYRQVGDAWTVSDVPLLDEAVEFLGAGSADNQAEAGTGRHLDYAAEVLQVLDTDQNADEDMLRPSDLIDAQHLAERHAERDHRDLAQRAVEDRDWTYGHVVVDEAQELSTMDWRSIMRRCPSKSLTIVGDLAQRQSPAGARSWNAMLDRYVPNRWTYRELTINYRTPAEIMTVAADVLAQVDPNLEPPESVRSTGVPPQACRVRLEDLTATVADLVQNGPREGSAAVIVPEGTAIDLDATVLTPRRCKGLEFDLVVVVQPHRILTTPPHGAAELYVAVTRATQQLIVLHTEPLPPALRKLTPLHTG